MNYFLRHIAQTNLLRTILLFVLGLAMWIPSLVGAENVWLVAVCMALVLTNMILFITLFCRMDVTNLPSPFVASTYWFAMAAVPMLHTCWQGHLTCFGILVAILILLHIDYQHEATEEAFLATLLWCTLSLEIAHTIAGVALIWGYLLIKRKISLRTWLASLIAIGIYVLFALTMHYFGWLEVVWKEQLPTIYWWEWLIVGGVYLCAFLITYLPLRKESVGSGVLYVGSITGLIVGYILLNLIP